MGFPKDFIWGAAAASYQVEGAAYEDGKGLSVWDVFSHEPGRVWLGDTGDVACDHYHRYREDVALMKGIGLQAYRLSISWPRVIPAGTGAVNEKGLDFYDKLIDALLEADITPYVTLFHWDYPYELYCRGGWLNPASSDWFADYTQVIVKKLGDRVTNWMTLNEPVVFTVMGHVDGVHAPGDRWNRSKLLRMAHNVLLSHGKSVQALRAGSPGPCAIGAVPTGKVVIPETEADIERARFENFSMADGSLWTYSWWTDPMLLGHYPQDGVELFGADMPAIGPDDMKTIHQPLDFLGCNIYQGPTIRVGADDQTEIVPHPVGGARTAFEWPLTPDALYWGPRFCYERYNVPVIVTENGLANLDWVSVDGKVHDPQRIDFTTRYLRAFRRAGEDGVEIKGYFHWSIIDNFEWAEGYKYRFGMIYVDYTTQERILKDSAYWYRDVIASNGANL